MEIERIEGAGGLAELAPEWRQLEAGCADLLPFATAAWAQAWWKHLREDRPSIRDRLATLALREGGKLIAVAPLMITERPGTGPARARCLQFLGADPNLTEVRGMLCAPGAELRAHLAVAKHFAAEAHSFDWMNWSGLPPAASAAPLALNGTGWQPDTTTFVIPLPETWEQLRGRLSRNTKEALRKCVNAPERNGLALTLEVVSEPAAIGAALDDFLALHAARARSAGTVPHADVFASVGARRFLFDVCRRLAAQDATRIFLLRSGGRPIAARVGFLFGRSLYLHYSGFDPAYAKYSVMTTCVMQAIKWAIAQKLETVNLSTGRDASKTRWRPLEVRYRNAVVTSPNKRAQLVHSTFRWAQRLAGRYQGDNLLQRLVRRQG